ncbi:MAG TPA: hypothetical protein VNU19_01065, partial [Candidatus Acidoferrum sp.]|nr:hypothetical protein [Candidatus Acidoferrum sp.]
FVWTTPVNLPYTMKPVLHRPFSVLDFFLDLDLNAALSTGFGSDSINMIVDYGSATEVVTIRAPIPIPPLPLNSYYDGIETLNSDHATGRHSFRIENWKLVGPAPLWADTTYVCPCPEPPSAVLKLDQTTVFQLLYEPSK